MDESHLAPNTQNGHFQEPKYASSQDGQSVPSTPRMAPMIPGRDRGRKKHKLILCFDGTGNKFHGDDSDSNILKIFRMLDREADDQYHYYQRKSMQAP